MAAAPPELDLESPDKDRLRRIGRRVRKRLAANKTVRRIDVDKVEMWAMGNFLDPLECGRLMTMIDAVATPSEAYDIDEVPGFRTSYSGDVDPLDPFVQSLQRRLDDLLGFDPDHSEPIQGQRYLAGQEFKPHVDWFSLTSATWAHEKDHGGQRAFTAMAYLNPVEEGGETDFPRLGIAIEPRPGTLLIWNNADENGALNPWTFHAGNPVTKGTKYIITKWYRSDRRGLRPAAPAPRR